MSKKRIIWIVVAIVFLVAVYFVFGDSSPQVDESGVPIMDEFDNKIVYTTDVSQDMQVFRAHCELKGGTFNECGSICPPESEFCAEVCAYTCEDLSAPDETMNAEDGSEEPVGTSETTTTDDASTSPSS